MQMPIKHLLERNALSVAITITILIAVVSLISLGSFGLKLGLSKVENSDKFGHAIAYFVLAIVWFYALKFHEKPFKQKIIIIALLIIYGIILEALQDGLTTYRTGDYVDVIANSIGVLLAALSFNKLNNMFNSIIK